MLRCCRARRGACSRFLLLGPLSVVACSPAVSRGGGYCAPPSTASFSLTVGAPPPDGSPREAHISALLGLTRENSEEAPRSTEARSRVVERLELASLAIEATAAELDCESERAEQAAGYLTRGQTTSGQALTIGSVVAAALTGIAGVFLSTKGSPAAAQDTVAVSGGILSAGLGLASLLVHPRMMFEHSRNLLADVWFGPATSTVYPSVVWAYLTRPSFSNSGRAAIREKIVSRWKNFQQVEEPATAAMLFGQGGSYDADALRLRAAMLDEVKAEVELAHQDLAALAVVLLP